jgi:hypothetical protein
MLVVHFTAISVESLLAVEFTAVAELTESLAAESSVMIVIAPPVSIPRPVVFAMEAVKPRSRANENAVHEILRSVIPVRSAGVWVIPIIAIRAGGWRTDGDGSRNVHRSRHAHANAYCDSNLGVGSGCHRAGEKYEKPE